VQRHPANGNAPTVCAVVVTYNRRDLLERCLDCLDSQTRPPDLILVIDNASTDGTAEALAGREGCEVLTLDENLGGAGGFEQGLTAAYERGFDWIWLLDDDTFAETPCLERLLAGAARAPRSPSIVSSIVRWRDGSLHPMNRPWLRPNLRAEFAQGVAAGLLLMRAATFVSTMIHRRAVERYGKPHGEYFIWIDDIEYTARILRREPGYIVPDSVAVHWTERAYDTLADTRGRFYYKVRNQLWTLRGSSFTVSERVRYGTTLARGVRTYLRESDGRGEAARVVVRGLRDGLGKAPR
jgi:rhamnopyranosyl-N-acetylglucosaminyl-diphospho-decaprenol beta-1,3/1,4-galactofuranosyltransferase